MRKWFVVIALSLSLFGGACSIATDSNAPIVEPSISVSIAPSQKFREPFAMWLPDCEDSQIVPCVTWDERQWRIVTAYDPDYQFAVLSECANEGGGKNLPCVWESKRDDIPAPFLVYTHSLTLTQ